MLVSPRGGRGRGSPGSSPNHEDSAFDPHRRPWESSRDARGPWRGATPWVTWGRHSGAVGGSLDWGFHQKEGAGQGQQVWDCPV